MIVTMRNYRKERDVDHGVEKVSMKIGEKMLSGWEARAASASYRYRLQCAPFGLRHKRQHGALKLVTGGLHIASHETD